VAVTLKLARHGAKGKPYFRIVASEKGAKRDGRFIEVVGTYQPLFNPAKVTLKEDRVRRWIESGALATQKVAALVEKQIPGLISKRIEHKRAKIQARRKARKARLGKTPRKPAKKAAKAPKKK
jgi:small subunit ribosomal protein S16